MSTQTFNESDRAGAFLLSEAPGSLSRETVTVASGEDLGPGAVLGKSTKRQAAAAIPTIVGTGTGAMTALSFGPDVQVGEYVVTLTETGATAAFTVVAPDGTSLPNGAVGTAYRSSHISFLVSSAGTMTAGDSYTVAVTASAVPTIVGTGSGAMSGISLGAAAQNGAYTVKVLTTSATAELEVTAPDGSQLPAGKIGTAYTSNHINFTVASGGTMTAGDYYVLIVANGTGAVSELDPTATDGTQNPYGILFDAVDATAAAANGAAIVRNAEVNGNLLQYGSAVTSAQKASAAAAMAASANIIVRS